MQAGLRIGLSLALLVGWTGLYVVIAMVPDSGVRGFFLMLAGIYSIGIVGLVMRSFWARWYARGLAMWGASTGVLLMFMGGVSPGLIAFAATHAVVLLALAGRVVGAVYDERPEFVEHTDPMVVKQLRSMFTNLGTLLPFVAFYVFFPRSGAVAAAVALGFGALAVLGLSRKKTWGVLALFAAVASLGVAGAMGAGVGALLLGAVLFVSGAAVVPYLIRFLRAPIES
jgi:hypothetical protein